MAEWDAELEELRRRRELATAQGGQKAVDKHHSLGRLSIRERIDSLVENGTFDEHGSMAGQGDYDEDGRLIAFSPANYVVGTGSINGRRVAVGGEDFTQKGGSPNAAGLRKSVYVEELSSRYKLPLVRLLEGGGGSVAGSGGRRPSAGDPVFATPRFASIARLLGEVPVVSAALGPVAGFPAARLAASHFSVMTRDTSQVMVAGPAVVERAIGKKITKQALGGAHVHGANGVVDNVAASELDAFDQIRCFLSYLPTHVWEPAPRYENTDPVERADESLADAIPRDRRKTYDIRAILRSVFDADSVFELTPGYGRSTVTALARLNGRSVGVIANDCVFFAGAMTAAAAQKMRRFVELCDTFHIPIVNLVDEPGFMIGPEAESEGTIRYGVSVIATVMQCRVPWATIVIRKAYGVAAAAHFGREPYVLSWPSAETGALPLEGGIAVAFKREIESSPDPDARRRELEESFAASRTPFARAEHFSVHDTIDPRQSRAALARWMDDTAHLIAHDLGPRGYTYRPA